MGASKSRKPVGLLLSALLCLAIGAASIGGLFLREDPVARVLFGAAWGTLGVIWLGKYAMSGRRERAQDETPRR